MQQLIHLALGKANPERMNGVNKVVHSLAKAQAAAGTPVAVWGITKAHREHNYPEREFKTWLFPKLPYRFGISQELKEAIRALPDESVVHIHGGFIPEFYAATRFIHKAKPHIRVVLTSHGAYNLMALKKSSLTKKTYYHLFERSTILRSSLVHLLGPSEVDGFKAFTGLSTFPVVCIPNGQALQNQASRIKVPLQPFIITFCGRMDLYTKGLDIMLNAFYDFLKETGATATFKIIGDGQNIGDVRHLVRKLGLEPSVEFLGSRFGGEKDALISESHVFLHTSRNEGVPMAVLEAAALHVPVIISEETNLGDYVRQYNAGWCLHQNNQQHLTQALKEAYALLRAVDQTAYETLRQNSFTMIREALNWDALARMWKEVYANLD